MTDKIFKYLLLSAVTVFLLASVIVFAFTYHSYSTLALEDVKQSCEYVKVGMEEYGSQYLESLDDVEGRVTHILPDGSVAFDSYAGGTELGNHLDREEVREALQKGEGSAVRDSASFGKNTAYYAMRLSDGSVIRVAFDHYSPFNVLVGLLQPVLVLLVAVIVIAMILAFRLSKALTKPINSIDLEHPESSEIYTELKPMVAKLAEQNYRITKQMRELSRRQSEFASITSNMSEGILILNSKAIVLSCNKSAENILGYSARESANILSMPVFDSFRNEIIGALSGVSGSSDQQIGGRIFRFIATPVSNDGRIIGIVILIIDVTERERREELRREFTSNVSHELKTPLTSISGFAELIKDGIADGEDSRKFASNIYKEAQRLIVLVRDVIKISEAESGAISVDGEIDLSEVCTEVVDRLNPVAEKVGVSLTYSGISCTVVGNRQLLEEMVYNLTDNAIKYNNPEGRVDICCTCSDGQVVLTVSDNGIGIPQGEQDRVFERFYRVDKSRSKAIGGTGLGLSIVKHAAAFHKAEISLESQPDVGTSITVTFPKQTDR